MFYTVYKITNTINGKIYVGTHKCSNVDDGYFGSGSIISQALRKYGKSNFRKDIIFYAESEEEMFDVERILVDSTFVARPDTYNLCEGGLGNPDLGKTVVERNIGIHSLSHEERSIISKTVQKNRDPIERNAMCSRGGKIGAKIGMERKSGIFGLSKEQRVLNSALGIKSQRERSLGFYNSELQSELGKRGGVKSKNTVWYTDGIHEYKFRETEDKTFSEFLSENPQFRVGRLKQEYKPRPKQSGKVSLTNGVINFMVDGKEAAIKFVSENPDFRLGRTNINKGKSNGK